MIPRLNISFTLRRQWQYVFGIQYVAAPGEYLLNHARTGIVMALRAALPKECRVGVVAYNCHTVANAVVNAGCIPIFLDVTDELKIDVGSIPRDLDAIVVTNLFGIRNDIPSIRKRCSSAVIIVDNAHGYGLPTEGDFTVYSINQGKFPALGEGGILTVNDDRLKIKRRIDDSYKALPKYSILAQYKLFVKMWVKAVAYLETCYRLVRKLKKNANPKVHDQIVLKQMAPGVRRLYRAWLPYADKAIANQRMNAERMGRVVVNRLVDEWIVGENAFMAVARCKNPNELKKWYAKRGIETETHFKHALDWAKEFGYIPGSCPTAERLTKELLMIPTYKR